MKTSSRHLARAISVFTLVLVSGGLVLWPATPLPAQGTKKDDGPPFNDNIDDPAAWGKAFPLHYELYLKSADMTRTKHGGSESMPHTPTKEDPRTAVSRSKSDEDAGLKAI